MGSGGDGAQVLRLRLSGAVDSTRPARSTSSRFAEPGRQPRIPARSNSIRFGKNAPNVVTSFARPRYPTAIRDEGDARLSGGDTMTLAGRARGRANP
ncbi:hypothetical protein A8D61_13175 [Burkholderia cenocepacia]|nr:hypothetical protein A8D61_13175 [Burkholderia cenocepacia]ONJ19143.1 hypothetical protein A8D82_09225 [Burkholderia cenocepacia]ONN92586.1 hypothetical protein A8D64_06675 [Burkholderia cenocepacia]ONN92904.1 hypothetical protein A8D63_09395 [Burkholderia cenocepacia]ONN95924.1 hypothetical protein A8D62_08070 [Burkholderia cenocepacia]